MGSRWHGAVGRGASRASCVSLYHRLSAQYLDSQVVEAQSQDGPLGNHQGLRGKEVSYQDSLGEEDHQGSQGSPKGSSSLFLSLTSCSCPCSCSSSCSCSCSCSCSYSCFALLLICLFLLMRLLWLPLRVPSSCPVLLFLLLVLLMLLSCPLLIMLPHN